MMRRALHTHRLRAITVPRSAARRVCGADSRLWIVETLDSFRHLLLDQQILRPERERSLVNRPGGHGQIKIFLQKKTEAIKQRGVLRRLASLMKFSFCRTLSVTDCTVVEGNGSRLPVERCFTFASS